MTDVLVTRDGLIGNSPRYTGHTSPPYQRYLKDDAGNAINLTGVLASAFTITLVNQSNPLFVKSGTGTFSVPSPTASQGLVSYQYSSGDVADAGNWYAFWTVQLSGEPAPRVFDPDFLSIILFPSVSGGGTISVTVQDVNLSQVNGTAVSSGNPVPTSGPVTAVDGGIATIGTTTDASSANTTIGLLKAIKAYLGATLTTSLTGALPAGTNVIGHVIVDSAGSVSVTSLPTLPAGTNVIGHVIIDSASSVSITSLPSLPAGTNTIGGVKLIDSAGTNVAGVDSSNNQLVKVNAALPAGTNVIGHVVVDSAGSVSVTSLPALPAGTNVIGHIIVDSGAITVNAGTNLNTSLLALESGGNLASAKTDLDNIKTYTSAFADTSTSGSVTNDNDVVSIALPGGQATALVQIATSNLNGTLLFEISPDGGTTWYSIQGTQVGTGTIATSVVGSGGSQAAGSWRVSIAGFTNFHVKLHPTTSGTATIKIILTQGTTSVAVSNGTALGQAPMASSLPVTMASDQSSIPMNLKQINGAALSVTNPNITELSTTIASRNAQAFSVAIQKSAIATGYCALSLFNPSNSGKTAYFRIVMADESTSAYHKLYYVTTDPNYNGTNKGSLTPTNLSLGGAASALNVTYSNTGAETDPPGAGSPVLVDILGQNSVNEQFFLPLGSGFEIKCPAGFGLIIYDNAATNNWLAGAKWFEA